MPLPTPILDDRSYQQLRDELVRRIPVYAPEWTDHNASDPGVTLIELFAFLAENLLFRFNQIPESTQLAFLRLLEIPLRPATTARTLLALTTKDPAGELVEPRTTARAGNVLFETRSEVHVWPLTLKAIARSVTDLPQDTETREAAKRVEDALELTGTERIAYYRNLVVPADPAAPGAAPVDFGNAVDGMLWIAALRQKETDVAELLGKTISVGFVPDEVVAGTEPCPPEASPGPPVLWQVSTGRLDSAKEPVYRRLTVVADSTRGLTRQGVVQLQLPREAPDLGVFAYADADLRGTGDYPPDLEDDDEAARAIFWLRASREDASLLGSVLWVGANATPVEQAQSGGPELLGTGNGEAGQVLALVNRPVLDGTLVVEVEEQQGRWTEWVAVDGFEASGEDARTYVVDREAGLVRFGNGVRGRAPQIGERVRATRYRYGGGIAGNVPAGAISRVDGFPALKGSNPLPARGGWNGETVPDALDRVPGELRRRDRAVTASDFRELALATPGAAVGRAECLPRFYPPTHQSERAGVVTVVVWPREDARNPSAPEPDRTLCGEICAWLNARRLVTTELYVIGPTYRQLAVAVGLEVKPGYGVEAVRSWVELVLRQYLAPLPPYGPDGGGWPLGRRVIRPELEAAALQVEGVEYLNGLRLASRRDHGDAWVEGDVELDAWEVPELVEITVKQDDPLPPGTDLAPPPPTGPIVPIPVLKEEC